MRAVVQRSGAASVTIDDIVVGNIDEGLVVLIGIAPADGPDEAKWLADKIANLRIFTDDEGKMNRSLLDVGGEALLVSQFTLYGDVRKGRRPSYIDAAGPEDADRLYEFFLAEAKKRIEKVESGRFRAMMDVELINDGPVTLLLDSERNF